MWPSDTTEITLLPALNNSQVKWDEHLVGIQGPGFQTQHGHTSIPWHRQGILPFLILSFTIGQVGGEPYSAHRREAEIK